jgi:hypothetical protein
LGGTKAETLVEAVSAEAALVAGERQLVAAGRTGLLHDMTEEKLSVALAPAGAIDHNVLDDGVGPSLMREIRQDEEASCSYHEAVRLDNEEALTLVRGNLTEGAQLMLADRRRGVSRSNRELGE